MVGDINYNVDFPRFVQYVDNDDDFQTEANIAEYSIFYFWEEAQFHKLKESNQTKHSSYDSDKESSENLEANEGLKIDDHKKVAALLSQENMLPKSIPTHQSDDLHTVFSPLNQSTSAWKENYTAIYDEFDSPSDHEQGEEFLSQESPKHSQVEQRVVLNEAYKSNPLD